MISLAPVPDIISSGMVCGVEEPYAVCVVHDVTSWGSPSRKFNLSVPCRTLVDEVFHEISLRFQYDSDTFELVLQRPDGLIVVLNDRKLETVEASGFCLEPGTRNSLSVTEMHGLPVRKLVTTAASDPGASEDDMLLGASASPTACGEYDNPPPPPPPPPIVSGSDYSPYPAVIRHDPIEYVGLVNQAMTCYLNSLLQALFMTPEFRNALYKWEFDGHESDQSISIPYQLQKLFLNLQTSNKSAVETTELTSSFGWGSTEAWQQHDIQELCRVMFDALEQKFKDTEQSDLISRLYEGKMVDYVKCLTCGTEKQREDTFLDIPLPVRPFGSSVAYGSVSEALRGFVQPETLDGNNQYFCEKCNRKCDAHKGLKFSRFPYLLTLHLKRFDFDYSTLHRIKLNDKVEFPEILNLNSFVKGKKKEESSIEEDVVMKCDEGSTTDSGSALDDESCHGGDPGSNNRYAECQDVDEGIDMNNQQENEKNRRHAKQKGPYMYELFSIMIHSGSASGGHYYAYIKDFRKGEWFCFNDQSVNRITNEDITKTYGGGSARSYYSGAYSSSTNAYMLMYRQIDKTRNCEAMTVEEFPAHIKQLMEQLREREDSERERREKEMQKCKFKVYYYQPETDTKEELKLESSNQAALRDVLYSAYKTANLDVPIERCRLVKYDHTQNSIEYSLEGRDQDPICEILANDKHELLLEIRREDEEFKVYEVGGVETKVFLVNMENEQITGPKNVRGNLSQTVGDFQAVVAKVWKFEPEEIVLVIERYSSDPKLLDNSTRTLKMEGFFAGTKVFVATSIDEDPEKPFLMSKLYKIIDEFEHIISLHVELPDTDNETLKKLGIPLVTLDENHNSPAAAPNVPQICSEVPSEVEESVPAGPISSTVPAGPSSSTVPAGPSSSTVPAGPSSSTVPAGPSSSMVPAGPSSSTVPSTPSARDNSPQPAGDIEDEGHSATGHSDQSASEDNSLTDSDRTLIGDAPGDCLAQLTPSNSPGPDQRKISSPEDPFAKFEPQEDPTQSWIDTGSQTTAPRARNHYFKASPCVENKNQRTMTVEVDKRMLLGTLKKDLEPYVGVPMDYFKIYRVYTVGQEFECARLKDSLTSYRDGEQFIIRLARPPKKGEHSGKVHLLLPNAPETSKFLFEWILCRGTRVGDVKKEILEEAKKRCDVDIPYDRCRLRKKSWKNPSSVYLDEQIFDEDISLISNWEIFLQEIPGPEVKSSLTDLTLFVKRWCPSTLEFQPFEEILLETCSFSELQSKLSGMSGIPAENIEISKGQGSFPCEVSVLSAHTDLYWHSSGTSLADPPFSISDDGYVVFYRDNREEQKELTSEQRRGITNKENSRAGRLSTVSTYSSRKERALKIYLDPSPKKKDETELD